MDVYDGKSRIFRLIKPPLIIEDSLDSIEEKLLKFPFLKISNSTIINLEHIQHISFCTETIVTLSDNFRLLVDENIALLMKKHLNK